MPSTSLTSFAPAAHAARHLDLADYVGAAGWARLPAAVRRRFGAGHPDVDYTGRMELRCSAIGRLYAGLSRAFGSPLTGLRASGLAATVRVRSNGQGGVVWERLFGDAAGAATVRSTKEPGAGGQLTERTDGGLSMALDVFEEDGSLVFHSRRFFLALGRLRIPVPQWLSPGQCCVTHTDLGGGDFRFTLSMAHPLWGETFYQSGVFTDPLHVE
ncbi:DUF4166 domain-containing protein [Acidovorax sp.]|uniref:DUF4166 domain-containing protein n=1 Tax=Acidovorax sp. TaxID=1872122 RepID=UPI00391F69E0